MVSSQSRGIERNKGVFKIKEIIDLGGGSLLLRSHTLPRLLSLVYPDFHWNFQPFSQSLDIWKDEHLANYFVEYLKKQPENELFYVYKIIKEMGNKENQTLSHMLKYAFPKYSWSTSLQSKKAQYTLKECLEQLFPNDNTMLQEYKHPEIIQLELDYFFPQYKLAFEYQVIEKYIEKLTFN